VISYIKNLFGNLTLLIVLAFGGLLSLPASASDEKAEIYGEEAPRAVIIEATPFESASLDQGQLVLKVKGAWLMDGDKTVKPGAEIRIAADGQVKLTGRHTQILVSFRPDRGALIETTFDARSFGGKLERKLEILAVK
jgi:hypothetical protein